MDEFYLTVAYLHGEVYQILGSYRSLTDALASMKADMYTIYEELVETGELNDAGDPIMTEDSCCISIINTSLTGCVLTMRIN